MSTHRPTYSKALRRLADNAHDLSAAIAHSPVSSIQEVFNAVELLQYAAKELSSLLDETAEGRNSG